MEVFSIVRRPFATNEPMSREDERVWSANEAKIVDFVREFYYFDEDEDEEKKKEETTMMMSRGKAKTMVATTRSSVVCCTFGRRRKKKKEEDDLTLLAVVVVSTDCATVGVIESVMVDECSCGNDAMYIENVKRFAVQSACERLYNADNICDLGARVKYEDAILFASCEFDDERDGAKYQRFRGGELKREMDVNEEGLKKLLDSK